MGKQPWAAEVDNGQQGNKATLPWIVAAAATTVEVAIEGMVMGRVEY